MRFGILGPLEVTEDWRTLPIGGPKPRRLLALLLVHANETVSDDRLAAVAWPGRLPGGVPNALQTQISRLRGVIDRGGTHRRLRRLGAGYVLAVDVDELDAFEFEALGRSARDALAAGDSRAAAEASERALGCWRGEALDEFAGEEFAEARAAQLEEQRLLAIECRIDARLELGEHRQLVGELRTLVAQHQVRESLWSRLILALYRSGRQSEALAAYRQVHGLLVEQSGITPGAELVELEHAVLVQDPALDWQASEVARPGADHPVTFLFTDVEQGTVLWDRDPAAMGDAVRAHDAVLHDAIRSHRGHVFARPGDGFCAVFDRAADAAAAALEGQRRLAEQRGDQVPLLVKMAVHTGEAELRDGSYFGAAVNRTAGLRDAGHGGQVLVSAATRELVVDALPPGLDLVDVGTWLFDGFSRSERVYQLRHAELAAGFPPLRSGRPRSGRIPRHSTSFMGRAREVEQTLAALDAGQLVTLTGEGGVGKTRLALEVAQRVDFADYPDGIWFCDISAVHDAVGLVDRLAASLNVATPGGTDPRRSLIAALQDARLLLVIDNCEWLRSPVAELVGEILASGSEATMVATSRAPLRSRTERVMPVGPLALPPPGAPDAAESPAVQLLVDRAAAAGAPVADGDSDPALVEIVRRLDGIPLAIELAAPRLATMSARALADRLDRMFDLLTSPASGPARQRTLRATIDWSFDLLSDDGRTLFGALSVFRGGWTLDTAEIVAAAVGLEPQAVAPLVADLADQSMIRVDLPPGGVARYGMLATMQAYAAEALELTGRREAVAEHHAEHFVALAEQAVPHRRGPMEPAWVSQLADEFDNLRAAYRWSVDSGRPGRALRLVAALADDIIMRERLEIGRWAEELAAAPEVADAPLRAVALAVASNTAFVEGRFEDARRLSLEACEVERRTGAPPCWIAPNTLALVAGVGAVAAGGSDGRGAVNDFETVAAASREHFDAVAAAGRETGDPLPAAVARYESVHIVSLWGQPERGLEAAEELLDLAIERGNPSMVAMGLIAHGLAVSSSDPATALRECHDGLAVASTAHNTLLVQHALRAIEELNARAGGETASLAALRSLAGRFERSGNVSEQVQTVISMLDPLVAIGALEPAATICGGLSRTPWRFTAACRLIDRTVADRMAREDYVAARRAGTTMPLSELVAFASACVKEVTGGGPAP